MFGRIILFLVFSLVPAAAIAGETPLYKPAPDWVIPAPAAASLQSRPTGTPLVIFDQQQRLDDAGRWAYVEQVTRATSAEALAAMGNVGVQWNPAKGDLIVHAVQIIRGAETIDLLAKGAHFTVLRREELLEMMEITGFLTATLNVEGLQIGDLLRVSYSMTDKDSALRDHVETAALLVAEPAIPSFARYRLLWPANKALQWKTAGKMPEAQVVRKGAMNELTIKLPLAKQPEMPPDAPPRFQQPPMIEASSFADWGEVSKTAAPLYSTENLIAADGPIAAEVKRIIAASPDPRRRAAMALQVVQDKIRYLAVAVGDGNYVPQTPVRTWEARFGDCKAKTLLLLAMLRAMDIKAEPVLAELGLGDGVVQRLPAFGDFNHVLVKAEIDGKSLWLDGTDSGTRIDDLENAPPLRYVLPVRAQGAQLLAVTTRANARPDMAVDLEFDQSAGIGLPVPYKISVTLRGPPVQMLRMAASQLAPKEQREFILNLTGGFTRVGSIVTHAISFDDEAGVARLVATGLSTSRWKRVDGRYELDLDGFAPEVTFKPDRARPDWQTVPVAVPYPRNLQLKMRLRVPDYQGSFTLQGDGNLSTTVAGQQINRSVRLDNQWLTLEQGVIARDAEIPVERIAQERESAAALQKAAVKIVAPTSYPVRWQETLLAKKANRLAPILALLDKDISTFPDEAQGYRNRASLLAGTFDRRKAIADLDEVIKREPDISIYIYQAGLLADTGDMSKALADLEAARNLDPGSVPVLMSLAQLHSERGETDQALKIVDDRIALAAGKERLPYLGAKANVLNRAGRSEEALQILDAAVAESPGNPSVLNGRCWVRATRSIALEAALKDCTKAIELADNSYAPLHSRAMAYFRMKRFEEAMADLNAADTLVPGGSQVLFLRGLIKKATGDKSGAEDISAALMISPRIDKEYQAYGLAP